MPYVVNKNQIIFSSGRRHVFRLKIGNVITTDNAVVVCLQGSTRRALPENVYAFGLGGELLWQIPKTQHAHEDTYYVGIIREGDLIRAFNSDGMVRDLDPVTGKIVNEYFGK